MITAYHKNELSEYKRMAAFHRLVACGFRTYLFPAFLFLAGALLFVFAVLSGNGVLYGGGAVLIVFSVAVLFAAIFVQNARIEKNVRNNPNYLESEHEYAFTEEGIRLCVRCRGAEEQHEIPWESVVRVYERKDRFYLYLSRTQALILPKKDITSGSADDLALLFRIKGKQFKEMKKLRGKGEARAQQEEYTHGKQDG